jgi:ubiquinone/menaquinone biosynthesis C-methylase UbiE
MRGDDPGPAERVAPSGRVVGIDLSDPMLEVARRRAADHAVSEVEFVAGDAQTYPLPVRTFGVAISRFGTILFADPVAAFANVADALAPGGRLCLATWQPLEANDWLMVPGAALLRYARLPDSEPEAPGMFSQSHPDAVSATLRRAGFTDVELTPVRVTLTLGDDPAAAVDYIANTGIGRTALATVAEQDRPAALDAVRIALADHTDVHGVQLAAAIWIVGATRRI